MKHYLSIAILTCLALTIVLGGCEKKASETTPIADVQAQAEKMNVEQLKAAALEYKKAIEAKKPEVDKIMADIKQIPATEVMGDKMKNARTQLDELNKSINALTERMNIFVSKLKEKGADTTGL